MPLANGAKSRHICCFCWLMLAVIVCNKAPVAACTFTSKILLSDALTVMQVWPDDGLGVICIPFSMADDVCVAELFTETFQCMMESHPSVVRRCCVMVVSLKTGMPKNGTPNKSIGLQFQESKYPNFCHLCSRIICHSLPNLDPYHDTTRRKTPLRKHQIRIGSRSGPNQGAWRQNSPPRCGIGR